MIRVSMKVRYQMTNRENGYETVNVETEIGLEGDDVPSAIYVEEMGMLKKLVTGTLEPGLRDRMDSQQGPNEVWNEPDPHVQQYEERTDSAPQAPQQPASAPQGQSQGGNSEKQVLTGRSKFEGRPDWWLLKCPYHPTNDHGGRCYADIHGQELQTNCQNQTTAPIQTPTKLVQPGEYLNHAISMDQARAIVGRP